MKKIFYSVATHDYLSQLMCAQESFVKHNKNFKSYIFVVDGKIEHVNKLNKKFKKNKTDVVFFCFDNIKKYKNKFEKSRQYYNNFEISCFAKIVGISYLYDEVLEESDILVFSDADLLFFESINQLIDEMAKKDILLTPHIIKPELDSKHEQGYLTHGWINAGFMIFRKRDKPVGAIISWLIDRIFLRGFNAPNMYMFVDQAWISSLPNLFHKHVKISQNYSANVAYWNFNERRIVKSDQKYKIFNNPIIFFHFSGYEKNNKFNLSKHFNFDQSKESYPEIFELMDIYHKKLSNKSEVNDILSDIKVDFYSFNNNELNQRVLLAERINKINIYNPTSNEGFIVKIARRLENFLYNQ